jgi:hypothetical protein
MWVWVARWLKKEGKEDEIRQAAESVRGHWRETSLDVGFDPDKAVTIAESDEEIRVGIAEEVDEQFREGPGSWRYY